MVVMTQPFAPPPAKRDAAFWSTTRPSLAAYGSEVKAVQDTLRTHLQEMRRRRDEPTPGVIVGPLKRYTDDDYVELTKEFSRLTGWSSNEVLPVMAARQALISHQAEYLLSVPGTRPEAFIRRFSALIGRWITDEEAKVLLETPVDRLFKKASKEFIEESARIHQERVKEEEEGRIERAIRGR
jgi:hypothetical protein